MMVHVFLNHMMPSPLLLVGGFCVSDDVLSEDISTRLTDVLSLSVQSLIFPGVKISSDSQFTEFLDGLGPAQLAGRQTLATPPMG